MRRQAFKSLFEPFVEKYLGLEYTPESGYRGNEADFCGDAGYLPLADASIDTILCTELMEHLPHPKKTIEEFARAYVKRSDKLLEIGCNTGKFLSEISKSVRSVKGFEFNSLAADVANRRRLDVSSIRIQDFAKMRAGEYDVVCAFQVLEHVTIAGEFIRSSLDVLRPGGRLILSVPNNEPYFQRFNKYEVLNLPPHHVGLWNCDSFRRLASFFDMTPERISHCAPVSLRADVYLRAKRLARARSLARKETWNEKFRMISMSPFAILGAGIDHWLGRKGFGQISVVLRKND